MEVKEPKIGDEVIYFRALGERKEGKVLGIWPINHLCIHINNFSIFYVYDPIYFQPLTWHWKEDENVDKRTN